MSEIYAHSVSGKPDREWETLRTHAEAVAAQAAANAKPFGWASVAALAGRLHDIGKCSAGFQTYLRGPGTQAKGPDHSTAGAVEARSLYPGPVGRMLAFVIAGHHAGLADGIGLEERLRKTLAPYGGWNQQVGPMPDAKTLTPGRLRRPSPHGGFSLAFLIRMLFSCLVDADFGETVDALASEHVGFARREG